MASTPGLNSQPPHSIASSPPRSLVSADKELLDSNHSHSPQPLISNENQAQPPLHDPPSHSTHQPTSFLDQSELPVGILAARVKFKTSEASNSSKTCTREETIKEPVFCVEDDELLTPVQHMVAGAIAGMTEHMAMFPIDTVKTRMQSYVAVRDYASLGMFRTTRAIVAAEGISALWRGVGAVAISAGPAHALYFSAYEAVRSILAPTSHVDGHVHPIATATAGICATVVSDGIMTPLDVVKQRMQLSGQHVYSSVAQCTRHVYHNHGFSAFFAGYRATLLMNVPFTAVYFSGYESAKKFILDWRGLREHEFSATSHCIAGGLAGAAAAACTNPLDVVKTRLQTQGEVGARRYGGLWHAIRSIKMEEGFAGLMRGVRPRVFFHVPAAAVCWTTYEFCKHAMSRVGIDGRREKDLQKGRDS